MHKVPGTDETTHRAPARSAEQMHAEIDARQRRKLTRQLAAAVKRSTAAGYAYADAQAKAETLGEKANAAVDEEQALAAQLAALDKGQADG
jgi:hypothetical protein